jgi:hypothetical protein
MSNILKAFNDHFEEFVQDVHQAFPEDVDILSAKNALFACRKANPRLIPKIWHMYVAGPYIQKIEAGDISFFIHKDYTEDIYLPNSERIVKAIDRFREPVKQMGRENQEKVIKYMQNLSKLAALIPNITN